VSPLQRVQRLRSRRTSIDFCKRLKRQAESLVLLDDLVPHSCHIGTTLGPIHQRDLAQATDVLIWSFVEFSDSVALYDVVAAELRRAIADGEAGPGPRMPRAVDLAAILGVNKNTDSQTVADGYACSRHLLGGSPTTLRSEIRFDLGSALCLDHLNDILTAVTEPVCECQ
jgi:hypothetical protein